MQVKQIAPGLEYLHGQSVVHGDLRGVSAPPPRHFKFQNIFWAGERVNGWGRTSSHL